jgi:hypothetical protein
MVDLLSLAVTAHGGLDRWNELSRFRARLTIGGALWALKRQPGLFNDVVVEGETRDQRVKISPFPTPGHHATWEPHRQTIETSDGVLVEERLDPGAAFAGHTRETPWDELHAAYFASEANWNSFVAPFLFTRRDFRTEELKPWAEAGQVWRRLLVTYPDTVVAHTRQQTYYFDDTGLLRRLDYAVDILGGGPAVHYPSAYNDVDGIVLPTRRHVYVRNADGSPQRASPSIAIELRGAAFD